MKKQKHNIGDLVAISEGSPPEIITGIITACYLTQSPFEESGYDITWSDNKKSQYGSEQVDSYKNQLANMVSGL